MQLDNKRDSPLQAERSELREVMCFVKGFSEQKADRPKREVIGFQATPQQIQPGECPLMFLSGDRNPDGTMLKVAPVPLPTKQAGNFSVLYANHSGQMMQQQLQELIPQHDVPELSHLSSKFFEGTEGYFFQSIKGDFVRMTDFRIKVLERQNVQAIDGNVTESILARLYDDRGWELEIEVSVDAWHEVFDIIRKKAPERLIASDEVPRERFRTLTAHILKHSKPCVRFITSFISACCRRDVWLILVRTSH